MRRGGSKSASLPRTIFHRALDAVGMSWDNMHLKNILYSDTYCSHVPDTTNLGSFNSQGQPLWNGEILFISFFDKFEVLLITYCCEFDLSTVRLYSVI